MCYVRLCIGEAGQASDFLQRLRRTRGRGAVCTCKQMCNTLYQMISISTYIYVHIYKYIYICIYIYYHIFMHIYVSFKHGMRFIMHRMRLKTRRYSTCMHVCSCRFGIICSGGLRRSRCRQCHPFGESAIPRV